MFPRISTLGSVAVAALSAAPGFADEDRTAWRVFIADQQSPRVTALDLSAPDTRWTFDLTGPSRLYATPDGEVVVAVQSDDDRVDFLRSGIVLEGHGDHADIEVSDPAVLDAALEGPRPFHVVTHGGATAINFDRGGYVALLDDHDLAEGGTPDRFKQNRAHHGFAVPMGGYVVSSVASEAPVEGDGAPPRIGIQAHAPDGTPTGQMQVCTDLHGEAFSGAYLTAGCKEGVVTVTLDGGTPAFAMLPYPADFPEGHTGTLLGSMAMQIFLGNYGADAVVIIDPTAEPHFTRVELPFRRVDFVLDPVQPQFAYILTEDGMLHRLNMLAGAIEQSQQVTQPYSMDGHWRDPRPRLAMADEWLLMTDPREGLLRVIETAGLSEVEAIPVEGLPYNLVAIGGSGLTH
ncbi:hypothetical protein [Pseudooceanicola sp. LIPI14-2-Ac024]|uniref:hypothetical protein n=1 Tax=Pseudooceanicola sp. LIPI14-2-Ac024 TaxID=3344875 RepID=UPI0035CEF151